MKISEVCSKTGLTKRTVRYYIEKGLISPDVYFKSGKEFREYTDYDVEMLCAIAMLRKLDIPIDTIGNMVRTPDSITEHFQEYKRKSREVLIEKENIYNTLCDIDISKCKDIFSLSKAIESAESANKLPQRDLEPQFPRVDEIADEQRRKMTEDFWKKQNFRDYTSDRLCVIFRWVKRVACAAIAVIMIGSVVSSFIPYNIEYNAKGYITGADDENYQEDESVKIKGKIYKPWFRKDYFVGSIEFEKLSEYSCKSERKGSVYSEVSSNYDGSQDIFISNKDEGYQLNVCCYDDPGDIYVSVAYLSDDSEWEYIVFYSYDVNNGA